MRFALKTLLCLLCLLLVGNTRAQKVGVVLSGGGATALAHIGFLKALEEEGIPIDYITGTSMGAIVGALYASGYSIHELDSMVRSDEFMQMSTGVLDESLQFFYKEHMPDAGLATVKYGPGSVITQNLPTNLFNSVLFDYKLMESLGPASAAAGYDFDSLLVPFRCVAANVETKELVVFDKGNLNVAVRASSTYPFFLKPIRVDGHLLFDGGLYDNFPSQLMLDTFQPDVILGCNVSDVQEAPNEDDLFSQLRAMIRSKSNYGNITDNMVVVEPNTTVGTFDFDGMDQAISDGYSSTLARMEEIKATTTRRVSQDEMRDKRKAFRARIEPLVFTDVQITGLDRSQGNYVRRLMRPKTDSISIGELKPAYFRLFADERIKSIFPIALLRGKGEGFQLKLDVRREKDLFLTFGGNFSSRPVNTGFIGLRYNLFGKFSTSLVANSYFGKYYGSVNAHVELDFSGRIPIHLEPGFTFNRWDYFSSFATFFEDVRPSFIVLNERFASLKVKIPLGNKGRLVSDVMVGQVFDDYYQTTQFTSADTTDQTVFDMLSTRLTYERSTLNRKQWANRGTSLMLRGKYVAGEERSIPGSTSALRDTTYLHHDWFSVKASYTNYFLQIKKLSFGFQVEGMASTQDLFQNYVATVVNTPVYRPIPESGTFYLPNFRAPSYVAGGLMGVLSFGNVDFRSEVYVFNALGRIESNATNQAVYNYEIRPLAMVSNSVVLQTPIGPASFSANYYEGKQEPWSFLFNFGYFLFNESIRD